MSHVLIVGSGEVPPPTLLTRLAKRADFIVAADGGADALLKAGVMPHKVIGDLDSVSATAKHKIPPHSFIHLRNQENTDLEKALRYVQKCGFTAVTLAGFTGKRWDFSLGNLLAVSRFARKMEICVELNNSRFYVITTSRTFTSTVNKRVSLIPLKNCRAVTLTGLKYPLKQAYLPVGTTRSLSNVTIAKKFSVSLESGCLAVYTEN